MGGNPLALAQAALLICKKGLSFRRFMAQFQDEATQAYLLQDRVFEELSPRQTVTHCWSEIRQLLLAALKVDLPFSSPEELENNLTTFISFLLESRENVPDKQLIHRVIATNIASADFYSAQTLIAYQTYLPAYLPIRFDAVENTWYLTALSVAVLSLVIGKAPTLDNSLANTSLPTGEEKEVAKERVAESKTSFLTQPERLVRPIEINFSLQEGSQVRDINIRAHTENYQQREEKLKSGWKLPRSNPNFIPREKLIKELTQKLPAETKEEATQQVLLITAVTGMGGVGKTELARHFVTQHPQSQTYRYRFWLDASTPARLYTEFRELAEYLQLIERQPSVPDDEMLVRLKRWLAINKGWLLVLDNADDYNVIKTLIPEVGGCVVVTTRTKRPGTLPKDRVVEVAVLTDIEAFDWLCQLGGRSMETLTEPEKTAEETAGKELVKKLGCLPLAIAQAAAYLQANPTVSIENYLKQFITLLGDKTHANAVSQTESEEEHSRLVVSSTWEISLREIRKKVLHAEIIDGLLNVCVYLAPKDIPLCLLEVWLKQNWQTQFK